jgi:hypothetical protein
MNENRWKNGIETKQIPIYSFNGYLLFAKGDIRLSGMSKDPSTDPHIDYLFSISNRISILNICYQDLKSQVPSFEKERANLQNLGYADGIQSIIMAIRYNNFLNSIYSLMENLAFLLRAIHRKHSPPYGFHEQMDWFLKHHNIDPEYCKILGTLLWYDEMEKIRSEYTHFLTGMIVSNKNGSIEYYNKPLSQRHTDAIRIEIPDIIKQASEIMDKLILFLNNLGKYLIDTMDKDVRVAIVCGLTTSGSLGVRLQSYNQIAFGKPGICQSFNMDCPDAHTCPARNNTDLSTGNPMK